MTLSSFKLNSPKDPSLVSRAHLKLQAQAISQAPITSASSKLFLNPGIYQSKNNWGRQVTGHHFQTQQFV